MRQFIHTATALMLCATVVSASAERDTWFHAHTEEGALELQLTDNGNGHYTGVFSLDSYRMRVTAAATGSGLKGELSDGYDVYRFDASVTGGRLHMRFDDSSELVLESGRLSTSPPPGGQPPAAVAQAEVTINGRRLGADELESLSRYGVTPQAGRYWYDATSGAWGAWGGPTAGFVAAGIPSAPLPANASNGNTGVHINGRNITMGELAYLQNLAGTPIGPGNYWLDSSGNAGVVGGPALINFLQAAQSRTSSWQGKGSAGYSSSDGSGGVWIANPYGGTGTTVTY